MTRWLVLGAGRSGRGAVDALQRCRPTDAIRLVDARAPEGELPAGVETVFGREDPELLVGVDVLVKSPGVPPQSALVTRAREAGIPVIGEVELAYRLFEERPTIVGITGTNGKTTTTMLVGAMLGEASIACREVGNIGTPITDVAGTLPRGTTVVCELSSFQLEDVQQFRPDVGVLLNVTPDHLDRHGSFEAYATAKLRLFERQTERDTAVLSDDDPYVAALTDLPGDATRVRTSGATLAPKLADAFDRSMLRGPHNRANVAAAAAAAAAVGADEDAIARAVERFAPPAHRLELVRTLRGVSFVNDSKATNVEAAEQALRSFPSGIHVILGGSLKGGSFRGLRDAVCERCAAAYLIGQAAPKLHADLDGCSAPLVECDDLKSAFALAAASARAGDVVLLAPACASFDQFDNFEHRGDTFRRLVEELG